MARPIDSSKLCDENGCADTQAWQEYQEMLGKAVAGDRAQVYRDTSSLGYGGTPAPATLSALPDLTLPIDSDERKEIPLVDGCLAYFPAALAGVARVSKIGNDKHNPDEPLHHARGKSMDHANCLVRHLIDVLDLQALFERTPSVAEMDRAGEALLEEASYLAWRALALSQQLHERYGSAPLAPAARE